MERFWSSLCEVPRFPELKEDIKTDVLVIGGGLAGLLTAFLLQKKGVDVVLVEKGRLCGGTTAGTTAKITAQHGFIYGKILKGYNETYAKMYLEANLRAAEMLKKLCEKADCTLENKDNFVYSFSHRKIEEELSALQKIGVNAKYQTTLPFNVSAAGAVGFENQAQMNPLELAAFLSKHIKIYENTKVTELLGNAAKTQNGRITAEKTVIATHFPFLNKHGGYFLKLYQHRSYVLGLENGAEPKEMYVDESETGLSFSNFCGTLILGGGGHRTGKKGGCYGELRTFAKEYIKGACEKFHWAAQDTMSLDSIPYIGQYSKNTPNLYVATGFNKWGMTSSMVAAEIIGSQILGKTPEYAEVFNPSRSIVKPQLFINGFETVKNLATPTSPRCPHLGCALKYNKEEHSWDCACHGSRFSKNGELLENPATDDLKIKE